MKLFVCLWVFFGVIAASPLEAADYSNDAGMFTQDAAVYYNEGVRLQQEGNFFAALEAYRKAMVLDYFDFKYRKQILNNMGIIFLKQGDNVRAEDAFNEALNLDPHYMTARLNLGLFYDSQGDKDKAHEYWLRTLEELKPKDFVVEPQEQASVEEK